jgi:hypothetical protein
VAVQKELRGPTRPTTDRAIFSVATGAPPTKARAQSTPSKAQPNTAAMTRRQSELSSSFDRFKKKLAGKARSASQSILRVTGLDNRPAKKQITKPE